MDNDYEDTIIDTTKPNAGRIYDYFCNGTHNFEIDRQAAEEIKKVAPFAPQMAQFVRWFLGEAIRRLVKQGFNQFIDFASGLPTIDHIHSIAPEGTKVIYSDIDEVTVKYGREIIGENSIVKYEICNAATPEILLESELVKGFFRKNHKCAIGFNGICWFLSNDKLVMQ